MANEEKEAILRNVVKALASLTDDLDDNAKRTGDKKSYYISNLVKAYGFVENQKLAIEMQKFEVLEEILATLKNMQK